MTKPIPNIMKYMTTTPYHIEKDASLIEAEELMQKNDIRHLPVVFHGKIEGVITSTDINLIKGLRNIDIKNLKVYDCFTPNPFTVKPDTHMDVVLAEMAEKKYGCALIEDNHHLVGIFTWIDALKATQHLLETRLK